MDKSEVLDLTINRDMNHVSSSYLCKPFIWQSARWVLMSYDKKIPDSLPYFLF